MWKIVTLIPYLPKLKMQTNDVQVFSISYGHILCSIIRLSFYPFRWKKIHPKTIYLPSWQLKRLHQEMVFLLSYIPKIKISWFLLLNMLLCILQHFNFYFLKFFPDFLKLGPNSNLMAFQNASLFYHSFPHSINQITTF